MAMMSGASALVRLHDVFDELPADRRPDVEIRDLSDRQPVLGARQPREPDANPAHVHRPERGPDCRQR